VLDAGAPPAHAAALGDAAAAEGAVGSLRADVLVSARGRPALALEVRVTHPLGPEKEAALAAAGVPVMEVDARADWLAEDRGRAVVTCIRSLGFSPCAACAALARADLDRALGGEAAEVAELEAYRARGLFGPARVIAGRPGTAFDARERAHLAKRFRCPDCGGRVIAFGERIARHECARDGTTRPIAWRGYDGARVELTWWSGGPGGRERG
jgi:hypothetical protein